MATNYKRILYIEDEVEIAQVYSIALQRHGFDVVCRYDGESGLQEAQNNNYDLLLLDLMLPNRSGIDILRTLRDPRKSPKFNQKTDIIIMTNFEESDVTKKELLSMAKAYLLKVNLTPRTLVSMLTEPASS